MKSGQIRVTIIILILVFGLVGYYSYLAGKAREAGKDPEMTPVERVLSRDLATDYPPTPKEVMKYYNDIMLCYYMDEVTDEEIDSLGIRARELFDPDLQAINEVGTYLIRLHADIEEYREAGRKITNQSVASAANVDYYERNGFQFARLLCTYNVSENGNNYTLRLIYLLRKDPSDKRWKIYGWDLMENVDLTGEGASGTESPAAND
ncbi:MAG: hypothetical protein K5871_08445 [Lachnospiraceae bacterium]|nr:hypothetical protein [Lachnospiraceae bacterium]